MKWYKSAADYGYSDAKPYQEPWTAGAQPAQQPAQSGLTAGDADEMVKFFAWMRQNRPDLWNIKKSFDNMLETTNSQNPLEGMADDQRYNNWITPLFRQWQNQTKQGQQPNI